MLSKNEIFSIYTQWENNYLPELAARLNMHPSNERQKNALFRVFDSLLWGFAENRAETPQAKDEAIAHRLERASFTLESANIPATRETLSAMVGMVASSFSEELGVILHDPKSKRHAH